MASNRVSHIHPGRGPAGAIAALVLAAICAVSTLAAPILAPPSLAADESPVAPAITMSLWQDGHEIARAGEDLVALPAANTGDIVRLSVMVGGLTTFRGFEAHLSYDATGLEYTGWELDKSLASALAMPPTIVPEQNRAGFVAALPRPLTIDPGTPFHIGDASFIVRDPSHLKAGILYMEVLDEAMTSTKRGVKPVVEKPQPEKRRLGDSIWWTLARPNPFAYVTSISFSTPDSMFVTMNVIDKQGKLLRPLIADTYRGKYTTSWIGTAFSGERLKNGEYIITFEAGGKTDSQMVKLVDPADLVPGRK